MRATRALFGTVFALAMALPAMAQQPGKLAEIHFNRVKAGMTDQYEAGRKKHMAWHKAQNDAWSWYVWQVITGEFTGSYVVGTFGHDWKDLDARATFNVADGADAQANMGSSLAREEETYYIYRDDLSLSPQSSTPTPLISVTHFILNPDGTNDFITAVKQVNEGIKKTTYPLSGASRWYQLASGGESPHFVLVGDHANWGSFQPPTDKSLDSMMEEAYGKQQGDAILSSLRKAIHSVYTEALQYRPDLSYVAGSK
jgi:hypothetical protein